MKHIRGPWKKLPYRAVADSDGQVVCSVDTGSIDRADEITHVISKAPKMLAFLEGMARTYHIGHGCFPQRQCGVCKPLLDLIDEVNNVNEEQR